MGSIRTIIPITTNLQVSKHQTRGASLGVLISRHYTDHGRTISFLLRKFQLDAVGPSHRKLYTEEYEEPVVVIGSHKDPPYRWKTNLLFPLATSTPSCIKIDLQNYKCALSHQFSKPQVINWGLFSF